MKIPNIKSKRILELDGLRGLAIVLVILNHFRFTSLYSFAPAWLHVPISLLINNGKLGVCLLFMLSGYLMATLYPAVPSPLKFWQKRYARIMPGFVAMCLALGVIRAFWLHLSNLAVTLIVILALVGGGIFWRWLQRLESGEIWGKRIFLGFLVFQIIAVVYYVAILSRVPGSVFYLVWPAWRSKLLTVFGNAALVLPFGQYLPQLDGVYWSIIAEMYFYLLYPVSLLPIVHVVTRSKNHVAKFALLVALFPFLYSLSRLSKSLLGFQMIQIHLIVYFIFGILLGFFQQEKWMNTLQTFFQKIPQILIPCIVFGGIIGLSITQNFVSLGFEWDTLLWVFPMSLAFALVLSRPKILEPLLANKIMTKLGEYSFALYLTHTIAIEMFVRAGDPKTPKEIIVVTLWSLIVMGILSIVLHWSLELPYFNRSKKQKSLSQKQTPSSFQLLSSIEIGRVVVVFFAFLVSVWFAFKIPVKLTALVVNHRQQNLPYRTVLTADPLIVHFEGRYPKLGMVLLSIKPLDDGVVRELGLTRGMRTDTDFVVSVQNGSGKVLTENKYPLYQIFESHFHPVGLPIDDTSQGESFQLQLKISDKDTNQQLALINNGIAFRSVYFLSKSDLIKHPLFLKDLCIQRIFLPFLEPESAEIFLMSIPLFLILLFFALRIETERMLEK